MTDLICKFCGHELVRELNHLFIAPDRRGIITSVAGIEANKGECLNRAGQLTRHHPDSPEWNGGFDYTDGRSRFEP